MAFSTNKFWTACVFVAFLLTACGSSDGESGPGTTSVSIPSVVGQAQATAESNIVAAGLVVNSVTTENSDTVLSGNVISQSPAAGTLVNPGSTVSLVVSIGPATTIVPDVVSLSEAQATADITAAGLAVGAVTQQSDAAVPPGDVVSQNPAAGTMVSAGAVVDLTISTGPASSSFGDEFDNDSLSDWSLRHVVEGTAAQYTTLDINQSTSGQLTIIPTQTPGWFAAGDAPFVFKSLSGNFAVHTRVNADSVSNPGQAPSSTFNSAGLIARNPAGATGPENYIMLNVGMQNNVNGAGSETKTTVNSSSTLFLQPGSNIGDLVLCRIGDDFYTFRFLSVDSDWVQTTVFNRPDLPTTLQVGMAVSAFTAPPDLRAEFEFIRLLPTPSAPADCTP